MTRGRFKWGTGSTPSLFFSRDSTPDFVCLRQKECTKLCKLTWTFTFFPAPEGAQPLQTLPVPTVAEVLSVLNLGESSFKKTWIHPWWHQWQWEGMVKGRQHTHKKDGVDYILCRLLQTNRSAMLVQVSDDCKNYGTTIGAVSTHNSLQRYWGTLSMMVSMVSQKMSRA